jgi:hypothetical protein
MNPFFLMFSCINLSHMVLLSSNFNFNHLSIILCVISKLILA